MSDTERIALPGQDACMQFAMDAFQRVPKHELEAHLTAVLIVFWGALWGSFGTEYARDFIEAQLRSMEDDAEHTLFTRTTQ